MASNKNKNVTFLVDMMKYGTGSTAVPQNATASMLQESGYNHVYEPRMHGMNTTTHDQHCPQGPCDPPGTLSTYDSMADSYDHGCYPSVYAQPNLRDFRCSAVANSRFHSGIFSDSRFHSGIFSDSSHGSYSYGSHEVYNSQRGHGSYHREISDSTYQSQASHGAHYCQQPYYGTPFVEPCQMPQRQMVDKHPSSPHPRITRPKNYYTSPHFDDNFIDQQQRLLDELDRLDEEYGGKKDSDCEPPCSARFGYFIRTAFCQVENLAARRRNNLREAIGDVARSKTLLELELRQQLLDIKKQRQAMEERFELEIKKEFSEKARREAELQSKLLDQMEHRVKLEMELSRTESVESYTVKTTTHVVEERTIKTCLPEFEKRTVKASAPKSEECKMKAPVPVAVLEAVSTSLDASQSCGSLDEVEERRLATATPKATSNDEQSVMSVEAKIPTPVLRACQQVRIQAKSPPFGSKDSSGSDNKSAKSNSSTPSKVAMFKPIKGAKCQSKVEPKPGRLLPMVLCQRGTLGLEVEEGKDALSSAIVARVVSNSQGDKAGVKAGDILCHPGTDREFSYHEFLRLAQSGRRPLSFNVRRLDMVLPEDGSVKSTDSKKILTAAEKKEILDKVLGKSVPNVAPKAPSLEETDNMSARLLAKPLPKIFVKNDLLEVANDIEQSKLVIQKDILKIMQSIEESETMEELDNTSTDEVQKKTSIVPEAIEIGYKPLIKLMSRDISEMDLLELASDSVVKSKSPGISGSSENSGRKSIEVENKSLMKPISRDLNEVDLLKLVNDSVVKSKSSGINDISDNSANRRKSSSSLSSRVNPSLREFANSSLTCFEGSISSKAIEQKVVEPEAAILDEALVKQAVLNAVTDINQQAQVDGKRQVKPVKCSDESNGGKAHNHTTDAKVLKKSNTDKLQAQVDDKTPVKPVQCSDVSDSGKVPNDTTDSKVIKKSNTDKSQNTAMLKKPAFDLQSALKFLESKSLPKVVAPKAVKPSARVIDSSLKPSLMVFHGNAQTSDTKVAFPNPDAMKIQVEVVRAPRRHGAHGTAQLLNSSGLKPTSESKSSQHSSEEKKIFKPGVLQVVTSEIKVARKVNDRAVMPKITKSGSKQSSDKAVKQKVTKPKKVVAPTTKPETRTVEDGLARSEVIKPESKHTRKQLPCPLEVGTEVEMKKEDDKENARFKTCLRVQTGLAATSPKALPFSPTHVYSPPNSLSENKVKANPKMPFSPTHCYPPNTFSPVGGAFFGSKFNQSGKNRPTPCKAPYQTRADRGIIDVE